MLNGSAMSYGYYQLSKEQIDYFLDQISTIEDPLLRGAAWLSLYEECLNGTIAPNRLLSAILTHLPKEDDPLNRRNLLNNLKTLYWRFLTPTQREQVAANIETLLWDLTQQATTVSAKSIYFRTYEAIATTDAASTKLLAVWKDELSIEGLPISKPDRINLACELALRLPGQAEEILNTQMEAIDNPDRKQRLLFIKPALSPTLSERDAFFENLKAAENRHYEPWVVDALTFLHHPLRAEESEKYILPSLELMEEIQSTGDIFFPRRWITATLSGHQSPTAAATVRTFLDEHPEFPYRLKNKVLMAADLLFRAAQQQRVIE